MKFFKFFIAGLLLSFIFTFNLTAQIRIVVLPFQNMDGNQKYNIYCYTLQDSVAKLLKEQDPDEKFFSLVPMDSVESILAGLNIDPTNPQYPSDMWKVVKMLNVVKVVTGNFNIHHNRFLINAYAYDVETKLPDPVNQAKDIFKKEERIMECVPFIVEMVLPALKLARAN